ncbi:biopolymer transporter ExbD [Myxococcota bacterium]|nr:biopolymer transporter ExbD [Myxococcota bacterium]
MAGNLGGDDDDIIAGINVTPLVDVTLVLLIIFMVTATYIVKPSIEVELPEAATGAPTEQTTLGITLDREGRLYLNGEEKSEDALRAYIREQKRGGKELQALIAADKDVRHGSFVRILDLVKQEGVLDFAINIDPALTADAAR